MQKKNILDLLDERKENSNVEVLDNEIIKKTLKKYILVVLIACIIFIVYGFLGKSEVPVANQTLYSRQEITDDMITMKKIPRYKLLKKGLIQYDFYIEGKYVAYNKMIEVGSCFYEDLITDEVKFYSSLQVQDGYNLYTFPISLEDYKNNNVKINDKVDIYFEYIDNDTKKIGRLISDVRVIDIRDEKNLSIFEPSAEERIPETMYLEVKEEDYNLLNEFLNPDAYALKFYYSKLEINTNTYVQELLNNKQCFIKVSTTKKITIDFLHLDYIPENLNIETYIPDKEEIVISGTESDLNSVAIVKALVDLSKISDWHIGDIKLEDIQLKAYSNTGDIIDLQIKPNNIGVTLTINDKEA